MADASKPASTSLRSTVASVRNRLIPASEAIATVAVGALFSMVLMPALFRRESWFWYSSGDAWFVLKAARYVSAGALGFLYEANPLFVSTPLGPIVLAPVAWVAYRFGLTFSRDPFSIAHPTVWPLYLAYSLLWSVVFYHAVRTLAETLRLERHRLRIDASAGFLVVAPTFIVWGHMEDFMAVAFLLFCVRDVIDENWRRATWALGFAIAFKQFAVLALPLVLWQMPKREKIPGAVRASVLPGALAAFTLAVDWSHASRALLGAQIGYLAPLAHVTPWWPGTLGHTESATIERVLAFAAAVGVGWFARRVRDPKALLAAFGVVLLIRPAFEPVVYFYYLAPCMVFFLLHERLTSGRMRRTLGAAVLLHVVLESRWALTRSLWWPMTVVLCGVMAGPAIAALRRASTSSATAAAVTDDDSGSPGLDSAHGP